MLFVVSVLEHHFQEKAKRFIMPYVLRLVTFSPKQG